MRTATINGIVTPAPATAIAWKHADPIEDARWIYEQSDYDEIEAADCSLLVDVVA